MYDMWVDIRQKTTQYFNWNAAKQREYMVEVNAELDAKKKFYADEREKDGVNDWPYDQQRVWILAMVDHEVGVVRDCGRAYD